jgi:type II secretory pathway pseudopilin PulG
MTSQRQTVRGYTIIELLVVIGIAALVIIAAVPALNSITSSARRASAENALRVGLRTARAAAIESGVDAAAVFLHEPGGRVTIIPCVLAGELLDGSGNDDRLRQIFAPAQGFEAVQLPRSWFVRAFVPENTIDSGDNTGWYDAGTYADDEPLWIFPETAYYDRDSGTDGEDRQTFMVRFRGGSGELNLSDIAPVLVFAPDARARFRDSGIWSDPEFRADQDIDPRRFVQRVLQWPVSGSGSINRDDRDNLLGDKSSDTVLTRAVGQLGLYQETALASGIGARGVNRDSGTLYLYEYDPSAGSETDAPEIDPALMADTDRIADWMEARVPSSDARLFTISRYLGSTLELEPIEPDTGAN